MYNKHIFKTYKKYSQDICANHRFRSYICNNLFRCWNRLGTLPNWQREINTVIKDRYDYIATCVRSMMTFIGGKVYVCFVMLHTIQASQAMIDIVTGGIVRVEFWLI